MNYRETLEFLYENLPMFQRTGAAAYKANLDNTHALDDFCGHPHEKFPSIHIAGTNGKGSVSHTLAAILQASGLKTGLYTSPHMKDFRERIRINGQMIPEEEVVGFVADSKAVIDKIQPSFFEITVLMAFTYFAKQQVDIAVIETGMGGRLDSTNIIDPELSIITNIGLDHTRFLGHSLEAIAGEKAGIIKPGRPVIIGEWQPETAPVFEARAEFCRSPLTLASENYRVDFSTLTPDRRQMFYVSKGGETVYKGLKSDLTGRYQAKNVLSVLTAVDILRSLGYRIPEKAVYEGIANVKKMTGLRGRWEEIGYNPLVVCDAAHNAPGIAEVMQQVESTPYRKLHIVWGMVADKDAEAILALLPGNADYYFTRADIPRALDEKLLFEKAKAAGLHGRTFHTVKEAITAARKDARPEDMIFIGGSTFVVAEALPWRVRH